MQSHLNFHLLQASQIPPHDHQWLVNWNHQCQQKPIKPHFSLQPLPLINIIHFLGGYLQVEEHKTPTQPFWPCWDTCIRGSTNRYCEVWACLAQPAHTLPPRTPLAFSHGGGTRLFTCLCKSCFAPLLQRGSQIRTCGSRCTSWFPYCM